MKRFTAYISKKEDVVAVIDNNTGEKYTTLEDILDLLNNNLIYDEVINELLDYYLYKKRENKAVIVSDVYASKISLLNKIKETVNERIK